MDALVPLRRPGLRPDPAGRKPAWLKVHLPQGDTYAAVRDSLRAAALHTVCEEARCPNVAECWGGGTATIMLLGDTCTRGCRFCNVKTGNPGGVVDAAEPGRVAEGVAAMGLRYIVLTTVDRDDLADGGAAHIGETIDAIKRLDPSLLVEALVGDFRGDATSIATVLAARPDVYAHNVETVERLTPRVRDRRMTYAQSLGTLVDAKRLAPGVVTKSSIMLGLGERDGEVEATMRDLLDAGVEVLTLGQYLRPSSWHLPVERWVPPAEFDAWKSKGESMGFAYVASGPLVRSSYKAGEYFLSNLLRERR